MNVSILENEKRHNEKLYVGLRLTDFHLMRTVRMLQTSILERIPNIPYKFVLGKLHFALLLIPDIDESKIPLVKVAFDLADADIKTIFQQLACDLSEIPSLQFSQVRSISENEVLQVCCDEGPVLDAVLQASKIIQLKLSEQGLASTTSDSLHATIAEASENDHSIKALDISMLQKAMLDLGSTPCKLFSIDFFLPGSIDANNGFYESLGQIKLLPDR